MRVQIGRFGLDIDQTNTHDLDHAGNDVTLSGRLSADPGDDLEALREQISGLPENPFEPFYPVIFESLPRFNGYYTVSAVSVNLGPGSMEVGNYPYTISMRKVGAFAVPRLEASLFGALRPNSQSVTSDVPWHAVPGTATYSAVPGSTTTKELRPSSDGDVLVLEAGGTNYLYDGFATFTVNPENYYDGSARIRAGYADAVQATIFQYTGASQTYVVPTGVTKVVCDVRGAQGGGAAGGRGGRVQCTIDVTAAETLNVYVGGRPSARIGGFNGGGSGGLGSVAGVGNTGIGYGGGGGSDVRQGGTALGNRVVIGGGGGGEGGADVLGFFGGAGGAIAVGGDGRNTNGTGGKHANKTVGGKPGTPKGTSSIAGTAGTNGQGGGGASAPVSNRFGGGGGGGGLAGGGGGSGSSDGITAGSGGGGSGKTTGMSQTGQVGFRTSHGLVTIAPVVDQPDINRWTLIGGQAPNTPFGWEISNGLLMVTPTYVPGKASFLFQCWTDAGGWSPPREWQVTDNGSSAVAAVANLTVFSVLENSPEQCVLRAGYEYGANAAQMTVTILLRRGSILADVTIDANVTRTWGWRTAVTSAAALHGTAGNGMTETASDADGNHWVLLSPSASTRVNTGQSGAYLNAAAATMPLGVGFQPSGGAAVSVLRDQWYAAQTVTVRPVLQ